MKRSHRLAKRICAAGIISLLLTSMPCNIMAVRIDTSPQEPTMGEVPLPEGPAGEAYLDYINKADTFDYSGGGPAPTGEYRYAIVQMSATESAPALFLDQVCTEGLEYIRVFQYMDATDEVVMAEEVLTAGVAGTGGFRGGLAKLAEGAGLFESYASSGTGDMETYVTVFENGHLVQTLAWTGKIGDAMPADLSGEEIVWADISQAGAAGQDNAGAAAQPGAGAPDATANNTSTAPGLPPADTMVPADGQLPTDGDRTVLTGTINTYDYWQTVELQGQPDPNGAWADTSRTYRIIVLDQPQNLTGLDVDDMYSERQVDIISVDYEEIPPEYDGKQITFSISPDTFYWPSDTGLPLGAPSTDDVHILQ